MDFFCWLPSWLSVLVTAGLLLYSGYARVKLATFTAIVAVLLLGWGASFGVWVIAAIPLVILNVDGLRTSLLSGPIMGLLKKLKVVPAISETERIALEAGDTWVEGELFSGDPNWRRITSEAYPDLTSDEKAFIDGPVHQVCKLASNWDIEQERDLPEAVWEFLKKEKFFGMIVPKAYGGLEFSALANSAVVQALNAHSPTLAITVMVPNSLGPAELLAHYGTEEQKNHYLPRLATGEEIPCFGLTEPTAGSDAGSIKAHATVFKNEAGETCLRINFEKRYITLSAISTLIGLAVNVRDPENILGKGEHVGITCVLVPADTAGVKLGRRHDPLGVPFYNCPINGEDVEVSVSQVIGGESGVGRGWEMLMGCLAAGRAISLPASSTGSMKMIARATSAYALIRKQFNLTIGKFEGIEEPLARIYAKTYLVEAARRYTCGGLQSGFQPSVVSAIMKLNATELSRDAINDGMDVLAGAAISRGPRNPFSGLYAGAPIPITVEGANILTRTMIIFGQGALRCHPFAYKEVKAVDAGNVSAFDKAFFGHIAFVLSNLCRSIVLSLTRGYGQKVPQAGEATQYYRKIGWASAMFAFMADLAMGSFGGDLKRKEKVTGRFADILSWMYIGVATLRRYDAEGRLPEQRPFMHWSMQYSLYRIQEAFEGLFANFDAPVIKWVFKGPLSVLLKMNPIGSYPSDELGHKVVSEVHKLGTMREALTEGMFLDRSMENPVGRYELALDKIVQAAPVTRKITQAVRKKNLPKGRPDELIDAAVEKQIITEMEAKIMREAEEARLDAVQVDEFTLEEYRSLS